MKRETTLATHWSVELLHNTNWNKRGSLSAASSLIINMSFFMSANNVFFWEIPTACWFVCLVCFVSFFPSSARMESCLDWCKCCSWKSLHTSQNSWEWPQEENSERLSKRCELEMFFLRWNYYSFATRVNHNKTICYWVERSTLDIVVHMKYYHLWLQNVLESTDVCTLKCHESNSKKASNDKQFSWYCFHMMTNLFLLKNCFWILDMDFGPPVGAFRLWKPSW